MATKGTKRIPPHQLEEAVKSDWEALLDWAKENPALSAAIVGFVLVSILAGLIYRATAAAREQRLTTEYGRALMNEDPALRATQLAPLTESSSRWTAEALYMTGEAAYQAQDYAKAKNAFDNLRQKFVDAQFTPDAVEGLGNIAENQGDYQGALAAYQEIKAKWAGSFASLRQDVNIGRCQEHFGNLPEAVKSYKAQVDLFPDSAVAGKAQESLDRLKLVHPEVFPAEKPEEPSGTPVAGAASTTPSSAEAVPNVDTSGTPSQEPPAAEKAVPPETEPEESGPSSASSAVEGDGTKPEVPAQQETAPAGGAQ